LEDGYRILLRVWSTLQQGKDWFWCKEAARPLIIKAMINIDAQMFALCHTFNQTSFVSAYLSYLTVYVTSGGEPSPGVHVKIMSKSCDSSVTF